VPLLRPAPRWLPPRPADPAAVAALADTLLLPPTVCTLLAARGHVAPEGAKRFLRPRLEQLDDPFSLRDMDRAVERLGAAITRGETILVHGDYDVDGMCSTAILTRVLRALGAARVEPFVPHRTRDGYDLGPAGAAQARAVGASLVVSCDCGTSALATVAALAAGGIDTIIVDHHLPGGPLPPALAVVNPRRPDCPSVDKDLAAAGLVFKLALALARTRQGTAGEAIAYRLLDLAALATVADVAPLRGENRVLVRYGLKLLADSPTPGVRALLRSSGLEGKALTAGRVGFILAPRLNAIGRIDDARRGLELLITDDEDRAFDLAREAEELNRRRQDLDRDVLAQATRIVEAGPPESRTGWVVAGEGWHPGVIGIVASRVVELTGRPAVLLTLDGDDAKGSGRSIPAFDLHAGLSRCRDLFDRFGGHRAAAGLTMRRAQVDAFAARFDAVAREALSPDDLVPELRVDVELPIDAADEGLEGVLRHFEPFGVGNPAPMLVSRGVRVAAPPGRAGADGLKLRLETGTGEVEAIGWGMSALGRGLAPGDAVDVAYRLERDEYRGVSRLSLRLVDLRRAG
jgi:single-stranded-DNA-specific exonuclease